MASFEQKATGGGREDGWIPLLHCSLLLLQQNRIHDVGQRLLTRPSTCMCDHAENQIEPPLPRVNLTVTRRPYHYYVLL